VPRRFGASGIELLAIAPFRRGGLLEAQPSLVGQHATISQQILQQIFPSKIKKY
jgi:hypothetical protein